MVTIVYAVYLRLEKEEKSVGDRNYYLNSNNDPRVTVITCFLNKPACHVCKEVIILTY